MQKDPWAVPADQRPTRCTSTALSIAASLLGACVPGSGARIMAFIGGPATEGPAPVRIMDHADQFVLYLFFCLSLIRELLCWSIKANMLFYGFL